jgi:Ca-activated chloride channel family protein
LAGGGSLNKTIAAFGGNGRGLSTTWEAKPRSADGYATAGGITAGGQPARPYAAGVPGEARHGRAIVVVTDGTIVAGKEPRDLQKLQQLHDLSSALGTEQYAAISDNPFLSPLAQPLSTFSIDVDTASYANMRRFLNGGSLPPPDAVRIEELVNYFRYDYPQPKEGEAFSVNMETAECPWNAGHLLLRVGLKGKDVERTKRPPSNLVFLLDVSGSMADEDKLPLLKSSMEMLTRELGEDDRVSIVTYAGEAGLRLPPTRGHEGEKIIAAIQSLTSGGSTNGSAGINIAYEQAAAYFVKGGTNRVILCTDGDLNVGITDDEALVELIKQKAAGGTFLTVLGFGQGNLKDAKMERLADNGNGLYAYIDSVREARKVLVEQLTGSTITIAKDVKIQIEFNPAAIASYRLIGYENRVLAAQDFNDDTKDAGEIGAGHTVTALYELVPVGAEEAAPAAQPANVDPLKYQAAGSKPTPESRPPTPDSRLTDAAKTGELLTLKLRYKEPDGSESKLLEHPLKERGGKFNAASKDLQFAASVASFGMLLRGSEHRGTGNVAAVIEIAAGALGEDAGGYRAEFVDLARKAQSLGVK